MERHELEKLSEEYQLASQISFDLHRAEQMMNDVTNDTISISVSSQRFSNSEYVMFLGGDAFDELKDMFKKKVNEYYDKCVNRILNHKIDVRNEEK